MTNVRATNARAASRRLELIDGFLNAADPRAELLLVGDGRAALAELTARRTVATGASFGIHKKTLFGLATEIAMVPLALKNRTPGMPLALSLLLGKAVAELRGAGRLPLLAARGDRNRVEIAASPGFVTALGKTFYELDLALGDASRDPLLVLAAESPLSAEIAALFRLYRDLCQSHGLATRGDMLRVAAMHVRESPFAKLPIAMLDVRVGSTAERLFAGALLAQASRALFVFPTGDSATAVSLRELGVATTPHEEGADDAMAAFRARLFDSDATPPPPPAGTVHVASAPGEASEAVELARHVMSEIRSGATFSDIAIVLRRGERYATHLAAAFGRADIPVDFEVGTRRPHPSGRAFLALLACRRERGSGRRLIEYLSTGELPHTTASAAEVLPLDEALGRFGEGDPEALLDIVSSPLPEPVRLPVRRWQRMLGEIGISHAGESASIAAYLGKRLSILKVELERQQRDAEREDGEAGPRERIERDLADLAAMERHLGPVLAALDRVVDRAPLDEQLAALRELAQLSLRRPELVLSLLAELGPLSDGASRVTIDELVAILEPRLSLIERPGVEQRAGRVLVTSADGIRGRSRRVVLMPGLAEGIVPEQPSEDPLLLEEVRAELPLRLQTMADRAEAERLALILAAGAAEKALYLTFPRAEAETGRSRVPSFYALEAMRAASQEPPTLHAFEQAARPVSRISAAWPSPLDPASAIDETEYALAVVRRLKAADSASARGRARFLVEQHPHLERALRARFRRHDQRELDVNDGFVAIEPAVKSSLARRSLRERAYSPSTLQAFAACPYRFYLKAMVGLAPRVEATPVDRLDPSQRGQLYHQCQAKLANELSALTSLPAGGAARALVERVVQEVATAEQERAEPLSRQVFEHQMEALCLDLMGYLQEEAERADGFRPFSAELRFGLDPGQEAVRIRGRFLIRGAIDSIELGTANTLRVTDYKTGRLDPELLKGTPAVGGGEMLQPLLYAMVADALRGRELPADSEVVASRLYFATRRGGYRSLDVAVAEDNLDRAIEVMTTIDDAIKSGKLFALPREGACKACAYRAVCGPNEEIRTSQKQPSTPDKPLVRALILLRGMP